MSFHFICSIRPEIRHLIADFDAESGKFLDGKDVELSWLASDGDEGRLILDVLRLKIEHSYWKKPSFEDFFPRKVTFGSTADSIAEFLAKNTWGRPRDVVRLLNSVAKKNPNSTTIGEAELKFSMTDYSRASSKELVDELGVRYGNKVLMALRNGLTRKTYSSRDQFWDALAPKLTGMPTAGLLDELFDLGFIGGFDPSNGRHYWAHRGNSVLKSQHSIRVHPALWSEFQIH